MRFFLPLCLALAACSSDPAPPVDSGPADTGPVQVDIGSTSDVLDVPAVPHDQGADSGAVDAGDAVAVVDAPAVDAVDAAAVDAGADAVAVGDAGSDVPVDARADVPAGSVNCGALPREPACGSNADCAMCQPTAAGEAWCCGLNGSCGTRTGRTVCD